MTAEIRARWIVTAALALAAIAAALGIGTRVAAAQGAAGVLEQLFPSAHANHRKVARPVKRKVRRYPARRKSPRRVRPARAAEWKLPSGQAARAVSDPVFVSDFDHAFAAFAAVPMLDATPIKPRAIATVSIVPPAVTGRLPASPPPATGGVAVLTSDAVTPPENFAPGMRALALALAVSALLAVLCVHTLRFNIRAIMEGIQWINPSGAARAMTCRASPARWAATARPRSTWASSRA